MRCSARNNYRIGEKFSGQCRSDVSSWYKGFSGWENHDILCGNAQGAPSACRSLCQGIVEDWTHSISRCPCCHPRHWGETPLAKSHVQERLVMQRAIALGFQSTLPLILATCLTSIQMTPCRAIVCGQRMYLAWPTANWYFVMSHVRCLPRWFGRALQQYCNQASTWDGRLIQHCTSVTRPDGHEGSHAANGGKQTIHYVYGTFTAAK